MADRPNLVFVFSDQQRYDTMRCYGNDWIQTPNLDRLSLESFVFRNAYVSQPVCTPARATIMTGLYPHTAGPIVNRVPLPPDVPTIAEMMSSDYICAYYGKWHLGDDVMPQHGFEEWISSEDVHRAFYARKELRYKLSDYHHFLVAHGFKPDKKDPDGVWTFSAEKHYSLPEEFQMGSYLGDRASEFIASHRDRPFILYVSTFEPHSPYNGPFQHLYDPAKLPVGPAFLRKPEGASLLNRARADYFMQFMLEGRDQSSTGSNKLFVTSGPSATTSSVSRRS